MFWRSSHHPIPLLVHPVLPLPSPSHHRGLLVESTCLLTFWRPTQPYRHQPLHDSTHLSAFFSALQCHLHISPDVYLYMYDFSKLFHRSFKNCAISSTFRIELAVCSKQYSINESRKSSALVSRLSCTSFFRGCSFWAFCLVLLQMFSYFTLIPAILYSSYFKYKIPWPQFRHISREDAALCKMFPRDFIRNSQDLFLKDF